MNLTRVQEHLIVYAKGNGKRQETADVRIGTVEHLDSEKYIKLAKSDSPDGQYHWIPTEWVESVDDQAVYLNKTEDEIIKGLMVYHCKSTSK
ncbi:MAG: DUF2171 domain-containing protein [Chroococcidiopsidaceae cyanobacterium CP_BM_ER_R8_30]|nr:DUF2171 domain-containing protein [Chroococcidiopsidaceae cyanobacterium CP_BM_ER_R8_30]